MTVRARLAVMSLMVAGATLRSPTPAHAEPRDEDLVFLGLGLAFPTYVLGVGLHEGSHAVVAKLFGAKVVEVRLTPGRGQDGAFHFGLTRVRGLANARERAWFYAAPKLVDVALLGGFAALVTTEGWPDDRRAQLTLTVLATGLWVDFTKDVLAFRSSNDVVKLFNEVGLTSEVTRFPARMLYAGASVGLGWLVWRGYQRTFDSAAPQGAARSVDDAPAWIVPLSQGRF